jgi:hypothetical protein
VQIFTKTKGRETTDHTTVETQWIIMQDWLRPSPHQPSCLEICLQEFKYFAFWNFFWFFKIFILLCLVKTGYINRANKMGSLHLIYIGILIVRHYYNKWTQRLSKGHRFRTKSQVS